MKKLFFALLICCCVSSCSVTGSDRDALRRSADSLLSTAIDSTYHSTPEIRRTYEQALITRKETALMLQVHRGEISQTFADTALLGFKSRINQFNIRQETRARLLLAR